MVEATLCVYVPGEQSSQKLEPGEAASLPGGQAAQFGLAPTKPGSQASMQSACDVTPSTDVLPAGHVSHMVRVILRILWLDASATRAKVPSALIAMP